MNDGLSTFLEGERLRGERGERYVNDFISGSIFVRMMGHPDGIPPGNIIHGHKHNFDHTSIFFCGDWHVKKWTPDGELEHDFVRAGPFHLLIDKDCLHEFQFLGGAERGIAWCVYSHREGPQGEVSQTWTGWYEAYGKVG
jgi:hypothetical protein